MAENYAKTMRTLAEDSSYNKTALRLMLKYEIQSLLDRLSDLGEDCMLLMSNVQEGTSSQLGSSSAASFLNICQQNYNLNLKQTYLKFCTTFNGTRDVSMQQGGGPLLPLDAPWKDTNMGNMQQNQQQPQQQQQQQRQGMFNRAPPAPMNFGGNQQMNTTRYSPYSVPKSSQGGNQSQNFQPLQAANSLLSQLTQRVNPTRYTPEIDLKKRSACRHYAKGHCWQGNSCSFLHTRDPQLLRKLGHYIADKPTTSSGSGKNGRSQTTSITSSDGSVEDKGRQSNQDATNADSKQEPDCYIDNVSDGMNNG